MMAKHAKKLTQSDREMKVTPDIREIQSLTPLVRDKKGKQLIGCFPCPQCDKQFKRRHLLTMHLRTHLRTRHSGAAKETTYECKNGCGRRFSTSSNRSRHQKTACRMLQPHATAVRQLNGKPLDGGKRKRSATGKEERKQKRVKENQCETKTEENQSGEPMDEEYSSDPAVRQVRSRRSCEDDAQRELSDSESQLLVNEEAEREIYRLAARATRDKPLLEDDSLSLTDASIAVEQWQKETESLLAESSDFFNILPLPNHEDLDQLWNLGDSQPLSPIALPDVMDSSPGQLATSPDVVGWSPEHSSPRSSVDSACGFSMADSIPNSPICTLIDHSVEPNIATVLNNNAYNNYSYSYPWLNHPQDESLLLPSFSSSSLLPCPGYSSSPPFTMPSQGSTMWT